MMDSLNVRLCVSEIMDFRMCISNTEKKQDDGSNEIKTEAYAKLWFGKTSKQKKKMQTTQVIDENLPGNNL